MAQNNFQGLRDAEVLDRSVVVRDHRPLSHQFFVALQSPVWSTMTIAGLALISTVFPPSFPAMILAGLSVTAIRIVYTRWYERLPFRQPFFLRKPDPQDRKPDGTLWQSRGSLYIGNEIGTDKEIWISTADALNHIMIFGATGAGKSELMLSLSFIYIAAGSGLFYIDPKASIKLNAQFQVMTRMCGRDDDFRLMNFMTAGMPTKKKRPKRWPIKRTNSTNQLSFLPRDACVQLVASLMPKSEGPNAIFSQNAMTLLTGLIYALVHLRDEGEIELSMGVLRTYLSKERAVELSQRTDIPNDAIMGLRTFLDQMGYNPKLPMEKQGRQFGEQYSYAANYFNQAFTSLIDTYHDIFETTSGDIDMIDVILNRRIVLALLPSLEKSPQECETLGKINLSAVRHAISIGLGDSPEGTIDESVNSLPLNADFPFASQTDEYAAIAVPGYAEVATQGRGLGISATVGSQDVPGIQESDKKGYSQLIANTRLKAFGRVADEDTKDLIRSLAGEGYVALQQRMTRQNQTGQGGGNNLNYQNDTDVSLTKIDRIDQKDLQQQIEGEYTLFLDGRVVRAKTFYGNIPQEPSMELRLNRLVCPRRADKRRLSMKYGPVKELVSRLNQFGEDPSLLNALIAEGPKPRADLLEALRAPFRKTDRSRMGPMDRALVAFLRYAKALESPPNQPEEVIPYEDDAPAATSSLSATIAQTQAWLFPSDEDEGLMEDIGKIEQAVGSADPVAAHERARAVLDAVHTDLRYPDSVTPAPERGSDAVLGAIHTLMERARAGDPSEKKDRS